MWPMSVVKRSVSIDATVAAAAETAAAEDGVSFSAWLSEAAERRLRVREGLRGVAEWEAQAGPLTPEERAAGEALLDRLLRGPKRRTRTA
jgi:alkylhydroperoxidase family enzyme